MADYRLTVNVLAEGETPAFTKTFRTVGPHNPEEVLEMQASDGAVFNTEHGKKWLFIPGHMIESAELELLKE